MEQKFEKVHTVTDFYDGPRGGIANFRGRPHVYESLWNEDFQEFDVFLLSHVNEDLFQLALEDWDIWLRWRTAFDAGQAPRETHPALPEDRLRHEELKKVLDEKLKVNVVTAIKAFGQFRALKESEWAISTDPIEVSWKVVESPGKV